MLRVKLRPSPHLSFRRFLSETGNRTDSVHLTARSSVNDVKAAEETQDVTAMDTLLKVVKSRSNPKYNTLMPMRTPVLWSETLLGASATNSSQTADIPSLQGELTPRSMHDSYSETVIPFGTSPAVLETYTNASGGIRTGKLMEHLDSLAGSISYKHMLGPSVETLGRIQERGFYIVTASVDRLDMLSPVDPTRDLRLSGQVIYTGRSSMEVAVKMESLGETEETVLLGRFSMVCRDAMTHRARAVNPLSITTHEERSLHAMGHALKTRRQNLELRSLAAVPPSSEEASILHEFYLRYGAVDEMTDERVWMGSTRLDNNNIMFPQERNVHQKIFGGHLMRVAYELGFTNATTFTRGHVRFLSLDGIAFEKPVPIGAILRLSSYILHSTSSPQFSNSLVHVGVRASVVDVATGREDLTNEFRFTYCCDAGQALPLRQVVPKTYKEAMLWLEGKRALDLGAEIREMRAVRNGRAKYEECIM